MNTENTPALPWLKPRNLVTGGIQLIIGLGAVIWAGRLWPIYQETHTTTFWWAVALACFMLGLSWVNIFLPIIQYSLRPSLHGTYLPVRLQRQLDENLTWSVSILGIVFGASAIPLWIVTFTAPGDSIERFFSIGLGLVATIFALIMLAMTGRQVYIALIAHRFQVEAESASILPGENMTCVVQYQRGRFPAQDISIYLECRRVRRESLTGPGRDHIVTDILYNEPIFTLPTHELDSESWHKTLQFTLPLESVSSTAGSNYPIVTWAIKTQVSIANAPDFSEHFIFEVLPLPEELEGLSEEPESE